MVGNPTVCIDSHEQHTFRLIPDIKASIMFVELDTLQGDFDASSFPLINLIITSESGNYQVISTAKVINSSDLLNHTSLHEAINKIHEFESIANRQQILTYGFTSGSTGPPKIIVYRNALPISMQRFENDLEPTISSLYHLVKWCGLREAVGFLKTCRIGY